MNELDKYEYAVTIIRQAIENSRYRAFKAGNAELLSLYYGIGVYGILLVISLYVSAQKSFLFSHSDPRFYLEYLGKVSFLVSDYLLIKDEIPGKADYSTNMNNWPLYILAQFLITLSRIFPEEMIF